MAYTSKNVVKDGAAVSVGAAATDSVVTGKGPEDGFAIHPALMRGLCIDISCSGVTAATGITLKLQTRYQNSQAWVDSKTAAVSGNGVASIKLLDTVAGDQTYLPLRSMGRIVVTTGAGDAITVDSVLVPYIT